MLRRLAADPLAHFLVLGGALFVVFALVGAREDAPREGVIVVTPGKVEQLGSIFARAWQRPPTEAELDALVADWVREEAAVREAFRLGLDRDDTVIRRRLRQKFEFMASDVAALASPTDEQLRAHLEANAEAYRVDPRLSFRQVFLSADRGEGVPVAADTLLVALRSDPAADASELGDRTMLEHAHTDRSTREIAAVFGPAFASAVVDLPPGRWAGPIESGYGWHLVIVDAREGGRAPTLEEVRNAVERDVGAMRRADALEALYAGLLDRYEVVFEGEGDAP
ncbi:MAG: peptidyl-prolyl cis-trans isomerase [Phycisphaerales bacterium]